MPTQGQECVCGRFMDTRGGGECSTARENGHVHESVALHDLGPYSMTGRLDDSERAS